MALQTSGPISLNDIHVEAGGSSGTNCTINDTDIRGLISKGSGVTMSFNEWYGASNAPNPIAVTRNISNTGVESNPGAQFYGYYSWDVANYINTTAQGSINNKSFTDGFGVGQSIEGFYVVAAGGTHGLRITLAGNVTVGFTSMSTTANGNAYTYNVSSGNINKVSFPGINRTEVNWNLGASGQAVTDFIAALNTGGGLTFTLN